MGSRQQQSDCDSRDGRVNSRFVNEPPHSEAEDCQEYGIAERSPLDDRESCEKSNGGKQISDVEVWCVEHGDDENCTEVVNDGEREKEYSKLGFGLRCNECKDGEGERDVRCHRNPPRADCFLVQIEKHKNQRGKHHPAERCHNRHECLARRIERTLRELVPELDTDNEEEEGEQEVGSPRVEGERQPGEPKLPVGKGRIGIRQW